MKNSRKPIHECSIKSIPLAHRIGFGAILLSLSIAPLSLTLSALPLLLFIALCFIAPFLPGFSFYLPMVSRGKPVKRAVAVTFDDGPDPDSTPALLDLLAKHRVSATFYVTGRRAERYPHLIRAIVLQGHTIGNHTYSHDNFIMLKSDASLKKEIERTQHALQRLGVYPRTFRPPVGITSPRLNKVLNQLNVYAVNFSCRAGDRGNRQIHHLSKKILKRLRSGDIIMLHDIPGRNQKLTQHWLAEVDGVLLGILKRNLTVLPLAKLIERPVMAHSETVTETCSRRDKDAPPSV